MREVKEVHISEIRQGDTIHHNGEDVTVCGTDIKSGFCGITIFGDSYHSGYKKVLKVTYR